MGHGSGREFLKGDEITRLSCQAVALLMGCSSRKLIVSIPLFLLFAFYSYWNTVRKYDTLFSRLKVSATPGEWHLIIYCLGGMC